MGYSGAPRVFPTADEVNGASVSGMQQKDRPECIGGHACPPRRRWRRQTVSASVRRGVVRPKVSGKKEVGHLDQAGGCDAGGMWRCSQTWVSPP